MSTPHLSVVDDARGSTVRLVVAGEVRASSVECFASPVEARAATIVLRSLARVGELATSAARDADGYRGYVTRPGHDRVMATADVHPTAAAARSAAQSVLRDLGQAAARLA